MVGVGELASPEARRVLMMRDPGRESRRLGWVRELVAAGNRRRR
jgi:hypothetical protein